MKTKWYRAPLTLALALCLLVGVLPLTASADGAPALGYSIHSIGNGGPYVMSASMESECRFPILFYGRQPTKRQLEDDGVSVHFKLTDLPRNDNVSEEQLGYYEDTYECTFEEREGTVYAVIKIVGAMISTLDYEMVGVFQIEQGGTVIYQSLPTSITCEKELIKVVKSGRRQEFYTGDYTVIYTEDDDVPVLLQIAHPYEMEDVGLRVYVELTMGIEDPEDGDYRYKCMGVAHWDNDPELPADPEGLGITNAVHMVTINLAWDDDRYKIDGISQTMDIYYYDWDREAYIRLGRTGEWFDKYSTTYYLVPVSNIVGPSTDGGSSSRGGSSGGGTTTADGDRTAVATTAAGSTRPSGNVSADGSVSQSLITAEVAKAAQEAAGSSVSVQVRNAKTISLAALKAMAGEAGNKQIVLHADTLTPDGRSVQGRLYVEPAKLTGVTGKLALEIRTDSQATAGIKKIFGHFFENKVSVVHCEQQGGFGARLEIAAKVDLSGLDASNLAFYAYDRQTNAYRQISDPAYFVDNKGYLHFYTELAGDIIITDGPLVKK